MPLPAINLSHVDIAISKFQEVCSGEINAGEVKLTGETSIDKVNNHVRMRGKNKVSQTLAEVLAVKHAFLRALAGSGVDAEEVARIRRDLGLAPRQPVDKDLRARSMKPLTRQQVREILDRNANAINAAKGAGTIRTSDELHARVPARDLANRKTRRDEVNGELDTRRSIEQNRDIAAFQRVIAGDVDFRPSASTAKLLATAQQMLTALLAHSQGRPRAGVPAEMTWNTSAGDQKVVMDTGLDEASFARKLEETIVRLQAPNRVLLPEAMEARSQFAALGTDEARIDFVANLLNDPDGPLKARTVAVMILHDRGVLDHETLSLPNRLKDEDAIGFLANLVADCLPLRGDALRQSHAVRTASGLADPNFRPGDFGAAVIPVLSDAQYNHNIVNFLERHPQKLPASFRQMAEGVAEEAMARFGEKGFAGGGNFTALTAREEELAPAGSPRLTPDALLPIYREKAIQKAAVNFLTKEISERMAAAGQDPNESAAVVSALGKRTTAILARLRAAGSPQEAHDAVDAFSDLIADTVRRHLAAMRCHARLDGWAREKLAAKLGVPVASLADVETGRLSLKGNALDSKIAAAQNPASTDAEIESAFLALVDEWVDERIGAFAKVDALKIPKEAKDSIKASLLTMDRVGIFDIDMIAAAALKAPVETLAGRLDAGDPPDRIYETMTEISRAARRTADVHFAAARARGKEIGQDEIQNLADIFIRIAVLSRPGLDRKVGEFLAQATERGDTFDDPHKPQQGAVVFLPFRPHA